MKRLLKISLDQALLSLTPILLWFILSLLIDKNLINVFTITYPLQCVYGIMLSPFSTGANLSKKRDKNKHAVMSGMLIGITLSFLIYGYALMNVDSFIEFMNMDAQIYRTFTVYAIVILLLQTIFAFILNKLYYEDKNSRANRYSILFNLLNFCTAIGMALFTKDQVAIVAVTLAVMCLFTFYVVARNVEKFRFRINLLNCFKYDSVTLASCSISFFVFLFGMSNALNYSEEFSLAIAFNSLITDTQWDVLDSISTLAKVDISKRRFNLKKSITNAYKLLALLYASSILMFICLYRFYDLNLGITLIFIGLEFLDFLLSPLYYIHTCYLQLNWSASKTTANKIGARLARLGCSFLPTPFCNNIGALTATGWQVLTVQAIFHKNFYSDKNGKVYHRRQNESRRFLPRFRYSDLPINKE